MTPEPEETRHRALVGGMWEEIGRLQFEFLRARGLEAQHLLIDVGCGALRGGVHFIRFLDAGNYFGIDRDASMLRAGLEIEARRARFPDTVEAIDLSDRIPAQNLLHDDAFRFHRFGVEFDYALAQSLFTHIPLNSIRLCLTELARCTRAGGRLYATFYDCPSGEAIEQPYTHQPGDMTSFPDRDPFHYRFTDFVFCAQHLPWKLNYLDDWAHPRAQRMIEFVRL